MDNCVASAVTECLMGVKQDCSSGRLDKDYTLRDEYLDTLKLKSTDTLDVWEQLPDCFQTQLKIQLQSVTDLIE